MRRLFLVAAIAALALPLSVDAACTKCVATQVTATNANKYLFGGTDAAGGIGDWYLTNKKVELIVDDIGTIDAATTTGPVAINKTSSNAVATGGTLVDVGLYKQNNDQLPQSFQVGGLSLANVMLFRQGDETAFGATSNPCLSIDGAGTECPSDPNCGSITVYGIMLLPNISSPTAPTLPVRTRYELCDGEQQVRMRTEVWNQAGMPVGPLPVIDVFLWGGRGIDAFLPATGRGYNHTTLDLSQANSLIIPSPYFFAPGNVGKLDGKISRNKKAKEVSYGYMTGIPAAGIPCGQDDPDGPLGVMPPANIPALGANAQIGIHGNLLSAAILPLLTGTIADGRSRVFSRSLIVGKRNDGNSVTGDTSNPNTIFAQLGYPTGTVSGAVSPGSKEEGVITFIRTTGPALSPSIASNSPVTSVRTKAGFKVVLPVGDYVARAVFPGRDDAESTLFTVAFAANTPVSIVSASPHLGTVTAQVIDGGTGLPMPAKFSFSPSPVFRRDFEAMSFDLRTGMCSNNLNGPACVTDGDCGGGNTCFRLCSSTEPKACTTTPDCTGAEVCAGGRCRSHFCSADVDCGAGYTCVANTASIVPEGFPGGAAQLNVVYSADGKLKQAVKPDTYTVTVSRGLEYSIQQVPAVVAASGTVALGTISLTRVVDTSGWTSADFHIHSGRSLDSSVPLEARVRSFAGEGVDVMVSTDHDMVTDYNPAIKKMKLGSFIGSIVGTEVTTSVGVPPYFSNAWGHINGWPQQFAPNERRSNSIEDENGSVNLIHDRLRGSLSGTANKQCIGGTTGGLGCTAPTDCKGGGLCTDVGDPVVQLNHVRSGVSGVTNIGLFDNVGYNPAALITDCQKYPTICPTSQCFGGTNDTTACVTSATCTGGGVCGCASGSVPAVANGCNAILLDLNVVPQAALCTTAGCGSGFEALSGTRNIDADMMEVDNGGNASGFSSVRAMRKDWLSLLNQNVRVGKVGNQHPMWSTGVSDSHRLVAELPGYSRVFVKSGDLPNPTLNFDIKNFNQKVLAGTMFSTTGPVFDIGARNGTSSVLLGGTLDASGGTIDIDVIVRAAPWIPIEEVRLIKNGCTIACYNSSTSPDVLGDPRPDPYDQTTANVVRFNATITDAVTADSYYILEASPNLPAGNPSVDSVVNSVAAGAFPYGFTNPIFADYDGGGYTGIGVAQPVCGALPLSCSAGAAVVAAPATTMFAKADDIQKEMSWISRILAAVVPSVQAEEAEPRPDDEAERLRQHEETIRKSGPEYFPRQFFVIPTPKAEEDEKPADAPKE